jgi:hypothetical protein
MTVAGYSMPGLKPIDPAVQRACYLLLAGGVVVFAVALYVGFVRHGNSALVFSLLGVTTLVFSFTVFILVKPGAFAFIGAGKDKPPADSDKAQGAEPGADPQPVAEAVPKSEPEAAPTAKVKDEPPAESKDEPPAESQVQAAPAAKGAAETPVKTDLAILMNTTLGDVLLAALRNDPEGAGQIFARAITQAEVAVPVAEAQQSKGPASA